MSMTRDEVVRLAELARLELSEDELKTLAHELEAILKYVDRLQQIDTSGVRPLHMPARANGWREDAAFPCDDAMRQWIFANFPSRKENLLATPGVFAEPKGTKTV